VAPVPALSAVARLALQARWGGLVAERAASKEALERELDALQANLERAEAAASADAAASAAASAPASAPASAAALPAPLALPPNPRAKQKGGGGGSGAKKQGRPSDAAAALLRSRRERLRALAAAHDAVRADAAAQLSELERDVAEDEGWFGLPRMPEGL
jgi:hypothetical protein